MGKIQCAAELDGAFYRCSGSTLEQVVALTDLQGVQRVVSDFQGAISRTVTVEAPYKYAEVMVRKQLQEAGEFDEPVTLVSHWKKKRGVNATDIFYTALPTRVFYRTLDEAKNHEDCILLFPLYAVLLGVLKRARPAGPSAVVFQHGRAADILLGDRKRIYYANRRVAFDESPEQIASLWQMVSSEITAAEEEHRISIEAIIMLTWIDSRVETALPPEMESKVRFLDEESLSAEGKEHKVSFLKALASAPAWMAISRPPEKIAYYCKRFLPVMEIAVVIIALCLFGGHFRYGMKNRSIEQDIRTKKNTIAALIGEQYPEAVPYEETFQFVKNLSQYRDMPGFKSIVNDIAESLLAGEVVQVMKVDYDKGKLNLEILGKVNVPFEKAFKGYQRFCRTMVKKGYGLKNRSFNTSISESQFIVTLERRAE
ncbi:MAG: hypothetical protein DRG82_14175 [Deltaproteobacteria bacterium]|nr:MAG: hypothetical protein DRG82_14175 [Deltaproteobacteria bacterium]